MAARRKHRVDLTAEQAVRLAALYRDRPDMTTAQLAHRFGIARKSVADIVRRQGVALRSGGNGHGYVGADEVARMVTLYADRNLRIDEIARIVGRDRTTVLRRVAKVLGRDAMRGMGRYSDHKRRYAIRRDLFTAPLSDDELWLFGLLMADGTTDGRWTASLRLADHDRDAIETARSIAGSNAPISVDVRHGRSDLLRWAICDADIVARLVAHGMVPNKSSNATAHAPTDCGRSRHFWRGLIDGDGTICWHVTTRPDGSNRRSPWLQVLGGPALLAQWADFVTSSIGGKRPTVRPKSGCRVVHISVLSGARARHMVEILYGRAGPALERKRAAAHDVIANYRAVRPREILSSAR